MNGMVLEQCKYHIGLLSKCLIAPVSFRVAYNVLRLGVCYFALQILQALDKIHRQNNSTKPLLVAGAVN
jgi:hypothetical protein